VEASSQKGLLLIYNSKLCIYLVLRRIKQDVSRWFFDIVRAIHFINFCIVILVPFPVNLGVTGSGVMARFQTSGMAVMVANPIKCVISITV